MQKAAAEGSESGLTALLSLMGTKTKNGNGEKKEMRKRILEDEQFLAKA